MRPSGGQRVGCRALWQGLESVGPGGCEQGCWRQVRLTDVLLASKGHLNAILAIKGNLTNSEVKSIRNILDINTGAQQPSRSLFSLIKVG